MSLSQVRQADGKASLYRLQAASHSAIRQDPQDDDQDDTDEDDWIWE